MMLRSTRCSLLAAMLVTAAGCPAQAEIRIQLDPQPVQAGNAIGVDVEVVGSGDFALGDARPRAWLVPDPTGECAPPAAGFSQTELDGWLLILRNSDNTISAVDPKRELASSNIMWIRRVGGQLDKWKVDGDAGVARLSYASGPDSATLPGGALNLSDGSLIEATTSVTFAEPDPREVFSALADQTFRLSQDATGVVSGDGSTIGLRAPASSLAISPDGRWLFALSPAQGLIQIVDLATGRLRHAMAIHAGFSRTVFTANYLYLREKDRPFVTMVRLAALAEDEPHVVAIPVGLTPSGDPMVPVGDDGVAFLHSGENAVYLYMESGMADNHGSMRSPTEMLAPYDVVKLRGSRAVDLAVYDRSLRQIGPGRFRASIVPAHGGRWRLVVRDRQSDQIGCHDFTATGPLPEHISPSTLKLVRLDDGTPRFRVEAVGSEHLPDRLALLAVIPGSNWQRPVNARREAGSTYRIVDPLPAAARVTLFALGTAARFEPLVLGPQP